jgi:hypothetical protein
LPSHSALETANFIAHTSIGSIFSSLLRRKPAHALSLKKNCGGTGLVCKTSDNEDSTTALGHSEKLSVQRPIGPPVPEFFQRPEEGAKVSSSITRQHSGDVLPDNPSRSETLNDANKCKHDVPSRVVDPFSQSGEAEGLAGSSASDKVN